MEGDPSEPRRRTQRRWTETTARLLGLSPRLSEGLSQQLAQTLALMGLDHAEARRDFARSAGLVGRGRAIVNVVDRMVLDATLGDRVLAAGHLAGLWGEPIVWDPTTAQRRFPSLGTSGARRGRGPPGLPTK